MAKTTRKTYPENTTDDLLDMLTYCRPSFSTSELEFTKKYIAPLSKYSTNSKVDAAGNYIFEIGESNSILFSCHMDTVHRLPGRQNIQIKNGIVALCKSDSANCLGADDAAGVWIMNQMIKAGIPGLYIFHENEERGATGSDYIANKTPHILTGIQAAIAFDRKGKTSVITHQGGRTCSAEFALSLCAQLGMEFVPDSTGLFTDTANYKNIVPECTNVSIGYEHGHSPAESLDINFIACLLNSIKKVDWSKLVISRDCNDVDDIAIDNWSSSWRNFNEDYREDSRGNPVSGRRYDFTDYYGRNETLLSLVKDHPLVAVDILEQYGFDAASFKRCIDDLM